jgi:hypothetical protein
MTAATLSKAPANSWTIAYRNPRANHFKRAANWSGTWAEAVEMARVFGDLHPELQVWYTTTVEYERWTTAEVNAGTLHHSYLEDVANIMVDSGKRVRVCETGQVDAESLRRFELGQASRVELTINNTVKTIRAYGPKVWTETATYFNASREGASIVSTKVDEHDGDTAAGKAVKVLAAQLRSEGWK